MQFQNFYLVLLSGDEYPRTKIFNCRVKDLGIMLESVMSTEKTRPVFPIFEKAKRRRSSCNSRRRRKSSSPAPPSKKQRTQCWWDDLYEDYDPTEEEEALSCSQISVVTVDNDICHILQSGSDSITPQLLQQSVDLALKRSKVVSDKVL